MRRRAAGCGAARVIRLRAFYARRAPAARRMAALGYAPAAIGRLLHLSARRVADALADRAANGRIWTERDRAVLARELGRV